MSYRLVLLAMLLFLMPSHVSAQDVAGTYTFRIMSGDSVEEQTVATGSLVLMKDSVVTQRLPADLLEEAQRESVHLLRGERVPSACFGFETSTKEIDGREFYGGIIPAGLTTWELQGDTIKVGLYLSPDAGMYLKGNWEGDRISGVVRQWEAYGGKIVDGLPFEAERTAPSSTDACRAVIQRGQRLERE